MPGFPSPAASRRHSTRMLLVGLFAMLLHLLAGSGLVRAGNSGSDGFRPDVCSQHGMVKPGAPGNPPQGSHDCCKLCAAGVPPLPPQATPAVAPVPKFGGLRADAQSAAPNPAHGTAHRPRGPPAAA